VKEDDDGPGQDRDGDIATEGELLHEIMPRPLESNVTCEFQC
jgi:hypothetical protein